MNSDSTRADQDSRPTGCPNCSETFIEYLRDPKDDAVAESRGRPLAICRMCAHIFPLDEDRREQTVKRENIGDAVADERTCPQCGYCLKTLKIGGKCPECGTRIMPGGLASAAPKARFERWTAWDWSITGMIVIAAGLVFANRQNDRHVIATIFAGTSAVLIVSGLKVLHLGGVVINRGIWQESVTGRRAVVWSVGLLLFGVGTAVVLILAAMGIIF